MNGIITISDGTATLEDGNLNTTGLINAGTIDAKNVDTTNMTLQNLTLTGSINVPNVNDIPSIYGNVSFQNLGNSYLANNVYLNGYLLPYFNLSNTSYRIGLNAMQYLNSSSTSSIAIGTNALQGSSGLVNEMPKSVVIGNNAFKSSMFGSWTAGTCYNNVAIGDNACSAYWYGCTDLVAIGGQVCSNLYTAGSSNSVVVGANIGTGGTAGYIDSVVIGSNILKASGCNYGIVIGANCFKNSTFNYANGPCVVGYNSALNVGSFNRLVIFGNESLKNINNNAHNMGLGAECGNNMITNVYCTCIGGFSNMNNGLISSTALGVNCYTSESHTMKITGNDGGVGGLGFTRNQDVLIGGKNRLLCGNIYTTASITLTFELSEYIYITTATTTTIFLPTPVSATTGSQNITNFGARFTIIRTTTSATSNITINAPAGQFIYFNGTSSSTYTFNSSETYVTLVCCNNGNGNATWAVSSSQQIATGGFSTGLSTNTINPYITANQCDLWTSSTASIINIGNQSTAQIINFSKINTNSIEPKTVGNDLNLFTTTIASFLNFGNSSNYVVSRFYLIPTFYGATTFNGASTFNGGITATATQTINFGTNAPYMRGDNIVGSSIGQTQIDNGYMDLWTNQTTTGGIKTFSNPPVMSGASITANSIPNSALQTNVTLNDTASTFSALKTFSVAPVMSGASISSGTIGQTQISNGYLDLTSDQTITSGIKNFATAPSDGFQSLNGSGTVTFSLTGGKNILLNGSGITAVTLPTPTTASIGQSFVLIRNGIVFGSSYVIGPLVGTDRLLIDGGGYANYQTAFSQTSITVTALATSGNVWAITDFNNVNGLVFSKFVYPLSGKFPLPSNSNFQLLSMVSIGNNCLGACSPGGTGYNTSNSVLVGDKSGLAMTTFPTNLTLIGSNTFAATTTGGITNTTAIGCNSGKLYNQTGIDNTLVGANTDFSGASSFSASTALGVGAIITGNNQVVLGRTTETTIIPSARVQYGGSYRPNSVLQTITANTDWNTTPPTNFPRFILFSGVSTTTYTLTLPAISNANIFEGMEFNFRRTNTATSATTTSVLQVTATGTDTIYGQGIMTTSASTNVLPSGFYSGRLVCVNKTTTPYNWAYFT
jgi:hypothetical protein